MTRRASPHVIADPQREPASLSASQAVAAPDGAKAACGAEEFVGMSPADMRLALDELLMHQAELERQNEDLRRRLAEAELAEARTAALMESQRIKGLTFDVSINAISVADPGGVITEANDAFLRIWGYPSKAEVVGKPIPHFLNDPKDGADIVRTLNETGYWEGSYVAKRKDGSSFVAHGLATIVSDESGRFIGYQSSVLDITERRRLESALQASESRYRELFELAVDGILQGGPNGIIIGANNQMLKLAGRTLDQMLGLHVSVLFAPEQLADAPLRFDLLNEEHLLIVERDLLRPDGTLVPVEMHSKRMPDGTYQSIYRDISSRRRSEAALARNRSLLAETERLGKIGGWELNLDTESQTWTDEIFRIHELEPTRVPTLDESIAFYTPSSIAVLVPALERAIEFGEPFDLELEIITAKGNHRMVHAIGRADLVNRRLFGFFQDITAQKQAELTMREWNQTLERRVSERTSELQQSEARFRQLAETTFEGVAITEDGRLIDGNAQLGILHGYDLAEMIGRPVMDFVAPESRAMVAQRMREGIEATYECMALRKDGSTFPTEIHGRMGEWYGRRLRITALRDLTESKRVAAKILSQQADLDHAQRLALISEVSAGIIHQISQPLSAIGINLAALGSTLAACPDNPVGTAEILKAMESEVASMRNMMLHMRTLARAGRSSHQPTDMHGLLEGVLRMLRPEADHREVRLDVELAEGLPLVLADEVQLNQVMLNLVRNAFDACVACPPDQRRVVITTRVAADAAVELCVRDTGIGISPEVLERLFTPFFTTKAGMGIGLRLSRTIVEAHGGTIEAANNPDGGGAMFRVTLPVHRCCHGAEPRGPADAQAP